MNVSSSHCNGGTELAEDNAANSGRSLEWIPKMLVVASLWIAYLLSSTALSVISPFFPLIVSSLIVLKAIKLATESRKARVPSIVGCH